MTDNDTPKPPKPRHGIARKHGYYTKNLLEDEIPLFEQLYAEMRELYPDLDFGADDMLLCDLVKTHIKLARREPVRSEEVDGKKPSHHQFDYQIARQKILIGLMDALGLNRKQRVAQDAKADFAEEMKKWFTNADARNRTDTGRTKVKTFIPVPLPDLPESSNVER